MLKKPTVVCRSESYTCMFIPIPRTIDSKQQNDLGKYNEIHILFVDILRASMQEYQSLKKFGDSMLTKVRKLNELSGKLDAAMK